MERALHLKECCGSALFTGAFRTVAREIGRACQRCLQVPRCVKGSGKWHALGQLGDDNATCGPLLRSDIDMVNTWLGVEEPASPGSSSCATRRSSDVGLHSCVKGKELPRLDFGEGAVGCPVTRVIGTCDVVVNDRVLIAGRHDGGVHGECLEWAGRTANQAADKEEVARVNSISFVIGVRPIRLKRAAQRRWGCLVASGVALQVEVVPGGAEVTAEPELALDDDGNFARPARGSDAADDGVLVHSFNAVIARGLCALIRGEHDW